MRHPHQADAPRYTATPLSHVATRIPRVLLLILVLAASLGACGEDSPEDRKLSELADPDHVAQCERVRAELGADAATGELRYGCYRSATAISGTCNPAVFDNCSSQAPGPCLAPTATSPLRTCAATVSDLHACEVAAGQQYVAHKNVTCAAPPASTPAKRKDLPACVKLCAACPGVEGCQ